MEDLENDDNGQKGAESFRTKTEQRLTQLETGQTPAGADSVRIGDAGADAEGNSLVGLVRTCEARVSQVESGIAENTGAVLRLTALVESQAAAIADVNRQLAAMKPPEQ